MNHRTSQQRWAKRKKNQCHEEPLQHHVSRLSALQPHRLEKRCATVTNRLHLVSKTRSSSARLTMCNMHLSLSSFNMLRNDQVTTVPARVLQDEGKIKNLHPPFLSTIHCEKHNNYASTPILHCRQVNFSRRGRKSSPLKPRMMPPFINSSLTT
jgi:hypothetical protein